MNFGDYSGDYKSKVFKVMMSFFEVDIESLSKLTGFTDTHLEGILRQDILEKHIGKRILSALNLTNSDYDWIYTVISEIEFDRNQRLRKLEEIRFKQRQLKLEQERVNKDNGKENSKKVKSSRSRSKGHKEEFSKEISTEKGDIKKGVSKERSSNKGDKAEVKQKGGSGNSKGDKQEVIQKGNTEKGSTGSKTSKESGQNRKVIKKRSKGQDGQKENNVPKRKGRTK